MTSGKVCLVEVLRDIPGIVTVVKKELGWLVREDWSLPLKQIMI